MTHLKNLLTQDKKIKIWNFAEMEKNKKSENKRKARKLSF